jgi:hypothetical protein
MSTDCVTLDVGGTRFAIRPSALQPGTRLARLFLEGEDVHRDPDLYHHVLDYVRTGRRPVVADMVLHRRLSCEFAYLSLGPLYAPRELCVFSGGYSGVLHVVDRDLKVRFTAGLRVRRVCHGACTVGCSTYVFGGCVPGEYTSLSSVECHTFKVADGVPVSSTRRALAPMPSGQTDIGNRTAVVGDEIFVFGGSPGGPWSPAFAPSTWVYSTSEDRWTVRADAPHPTYNMVVCAVGAMVYAFVGSAQGVRVSRYNTRTDEWLDDSRDPEAAARAPTLLGAVLLGTDVYILLVPLATDPSAVVARYSPASNRWQPDIPVPGAGIKGQKLCVLHECLYIMDEHPRETPFGVKTSVYNPRKKSWTFIRTLREHAPWAHTAEAAHGTAQVTTL